MRKCQKEAILRYLKDMASGESEPWIDRCPHQEAQELLEKLGLITPAN